MLKFCRRCGGEFDAPDPRRTVCDTCRPPGDREKQAEEARRLRLFKPLVEHAEFVPELVALGPALTELREAAVSQGKLVGALRTLTRTEGREGTRRGLLRVAAIALALARRLR